MTPQDRTEGKDSRPRRRRPASPQDRPKRRLQRATPPGSGPLACAAPPRGRCSLRARRQRRNLRIPAGTARVNAWPIGSTDPAAHPGARRDDGAVGDGCPRRHIRLLSDDRVATDRDTPLDLSAAADADTLAGVAVLAMRDVRLKEGARSPAAPSRATIVTRRPMNAESVGTLATTYEKRADSSRANMEQQVHTWRKEPPEEEDRRYDPADSRWAYIEPDGTPNTEMIERLTRSIVEQIDPQRIILFGSAARGEMHAHSDIDLLVIKEDPGPEPEKTAGRIRGGLPAKRRSVDIVLISTEDAELNRDEVYRPVGQALAHGRTLYER